MQSTDKNYMVPVGGAIICGFQSALVQEISQNYPGRASISPIVDLLITLLSMGQSGWIHLLQEREKNFALFRQKLVITANEIGEKLLCTPNNPISLAVSLKSVEYGKGPTYIGSMLFTRLCSGVRATSVTSDKITELCGFRFCNYGSHLDNFPVSYLNAAAAIGMQEQEIDIFCKRLVKVFKEFRKSQQLVSLDSILPNGIEYIAAGNTELEENDDTLKQEKNLPI